MLSPSLTTSNLAYLFWAGDGFWMIPKTYPECFQTSEIVKILALLHVELYRASLHDIKCPDLNYNPKKQSFEHSVLWIIRRDWAMDSLLKPPPVLPAPPHTSLSPPGRRPWLTGKIQRHPQANILILLLPEWPMECHHWPSRLVLTADSYPTGSVLCAIHIIYFRPTWLNNSLHWPQKSNFH